MLKFNNFFKDSYFYTLEFNKCVVKSFVRINASSKEQPNKISHKGFKNMSVLSISCNTEHN